MLVRDLRFSFGGGTGRWRDELAGRTEESFSIGGGGREEAGEETREASGSLGRSGTII